MYFNFTWCHYCMRLSCVFLEMWIYYTITGTLSVPFVLENGKTILLLAPHDSKSAGKSVISMKSGNDLTCCICLDECKSLRYPEAMVGCQNRNCHMAHAECLLLEEVPHRRKRRITNTDCIFCRKNCMCCGAEMTNNSFLGACSSCGRMTCNKCLKGIDSKCEKI